MEQQERNGLKLLIDMNSQEDNFDSTLDPLLVNKHKLNSIYNYTMCTAAILSSYILCS